MVNGQFREVHTPATVTQLLEQLSIRRRGIAVEINGKVLSQTEHDQISVQDGDQLEVVSLAGGG